MAEKANPLVCKMMKVMEGLRAMQDLLQQKSPTLMVAQITQKVRGLRHPQHRLLHQTAPNHTLYSSCVCHDLLV